MSGADRQSAAEKFPDGGTDRDVTVGDVERGFGLVDAAAANRGEKSHHQNGDEKSGERRSDDDAQSAGGNRGAKGEGARPVDGETEANDRQPSVHADENGEQQEE